MGNTSLIIGTIFSQLAVGTFITAFIIDKVMGKAGEKGDKTAALVSFIIGCRMCQWACPYEAPTFNSETGKMDKCDMCVTRLQEGEKPFCVECCPMEALSIVDMSEVSQEDFAREVDGFTPHEITNANLLIKLPQAVKQTRR